MENIFQEANPDIRFLWRTNRDFPPHAHNDVELVCLRQGSLRAHVDGKTYHLTQGSMFLVCPNQVHSYSLSSADIESVLIIIKPGLLGNIGNFFSDNIPIVPMLDNPPDSHLWQLLEIAYAEFSSEAEQEVLLGLLTAFFGKLQRQLVFSKEELSSHNIRKVLQYCGSHYKQDLSVESIAKALFLSRSYISHTFNRHLNVSFPDYINSLRSAEAARLLEKGELSISEVVSRSGFPSIRTFNRAFRQHYGMSPSQFRRKRRENTKQS